MCSFDIFIMNIILFCGIIGQDLKYDYNIEIPKYDCDIGKIARNGTSSIKISGVDASKLTFDISVIYKGTNNCLPSHKQKCTLQGWRAVRELEKHIKDIQNQKTAQDVNINNGFLSPNLQYILNVRVKNNGTKIDEKQYELQCSNNSNSISAIQERTEEKNAFLVFHGSNVTYYDIQYILNVEVVNYDVGYDDYASHSLSVLGRELVVKFSLAVLSVGVNQLFKLSATVQNVFRNKESLKIEWKCQDKDKNKCKLFQSQNSTVLENMSFSVSGTYNITIVIKKGKVVKQDSIAIEVLEKAYAKIDVDEIDYPADPTKDIILPVYVFKLITGCSLQWTSVNNEDYIYLNMKDVPGKIDQMFNITVSEDEFLTEIDEYSNNTLDLEYDLKIPAPKGSWKGLKGNSSYLFRLNVTCPIGINESKESEESNEVAEFLSVINYVTLIADIVISTNPVPATGKLNITPRQGIALETLFRFQTNNSNTNDNINLSVNYNFGILFNNDVIYIGRLFGIANTKSVLPYNESGIRTLLKVCNSQLVCSESLGPVVLADLPAVTEDQSKLARQLNSFMNKEEYYKAFAASLFAFQTYNNMDKKFADNVQNTICNLTNKEIKRLLKESMNNSNSWRRPANDLLNNIALLLNMFLHQDELLNNVVELRNRMSNKRNYKELVENLGESFTRRKLLARNNFIKSGTEKITLDEVKRYLVISELIITTSIDKNKIKQEKENLINQLDKFMKQLCVSLYEKAQTINVELKTIIFSIEKLNKNNYNKYLDVIFETNSWKVNGRFKLARCVENMFLVTNSICIGKTVFKNYFNKKGFIYMIKLFSTDINYLEDCGATLILPLDRRQTETKEPQCSSWRKKWLQSECRTVRITPKTIHCECNYLGYYSLAYYLKPSITTTEIITTKVLSKGTIVDVTIPITTKIEDDIATITLFDNTSSISSNEIEESLYTEESLQNTEIVNHQWTTLIISENGTKNIYSNASRNANNTFMQFVNEREDVNVLYIIIGISLCGNVIVLYLIRHVLKNKNLMKNNFPKYASLYHEELLGDVPLPNLKYIKQDSDFIED